MPVEVSCLSLEVDSHGDGAGDADGAGAGCVDALGITWVSKCIPQLISKEPQLIYIGLERYYIRYFTGSPRDVNRFCQLFQREPYGYP